MSGRAAEGQAQLAIIERELQDSEARLGALARLADRLDTLRRTIDAQPWTAEKDALVRSLAALDDAQHRLASAGPRR